MIERFTLCIYSRQHSTLPELVRTGSTARDSERLANELRDRGAIDELESFNDGAFASAKGGGAEICNTHRGKGVKLMTIVDRHGLPLMPR